MDRSDVNKLANAFRDKYGRELIGKNLGQFHSDFSMKDACGDIYSIESYFIGQKVYIDCLESVDKDGQTINSYHIRMKGISESTILFKCKKLEITPIQLYKKLYNGESIPFDLTEDGDKVIFSKQKDMSIKTCKKGEFTRNLSFNKGVEKNEIVLLDIENYK
jgi:hypothetical protein